MRKLVSLVIVFVAYATSASAQVPDKVQKNARVVENMKYVSMCGLNYTPSVNRAGPKVTVTFVTQKPVYDATGICDCVKAYMINGTGTIPTANATCIYSPKPVQRRRPTFNIFTRKRTPPQPTFTIIYEGAYDPAKDNMKPLQKLAEAIEGYSEPALGGYNCTQETTVSESGWCYIKVKSKFNKYGSATKEQVCYAIINYFIQGKFLDKTKRKCDLYGDEIVADFWADE